MSKFESAKLELNMIYANQSKNTKPATLRRSIKKGIKDKVTLKPNATKNA